MRKKVIVACAGAVATSTIAGEKIRELCEKNKIPVEICQMRISEIASNVENTALIVTTCRMKQDFGIPRLTGTAFITGIGQEKLEQEILEILKSE